MSCCMRLQAIGYNYTVFGSKNPFRKSGVIIVISSWNKRGCVLEVWEEGAVCIVCRSLTTSNKNTSIAVRNPEIKLAYLFFFLEFFFSLEMFLKDFPCSWMPGTRSPGRRSVAAGSASPDCSKFRKPDSPSWSFEQIQMFVLRLWKLFDDGCFAFCQFYRVLKGGGVQGEG